MSKRARGVGHYTSNEMVCKDDGKTDSSGTPRDKYSIAGKLGHDPEIRPPRSPQERKPPAGKSRKNFDEY